MNKILFTMGCAILVWLFLLILLVDSKDKNVNGGAIVVTLIVLAITLIVGGLWW